MLIFNILDLFHNFFIQRYRITRISLSPKEKMKTENYHKFIYGNIAPMKKRAGALCECKRTHIKNL